MLKEVIVTLGIGVFSYAFCRSSELSKPLEKAALVTLLYALHIFGEKLFVKPEYPLSKRTTLNNLNFFVSLAGIGYVMNFKPTDYFVFTGLASLSIRTVNFLEYAYQWSFQAKKSGL